MDSMRFAKPLLAAVAAGLIATAAAQAQQARMGTFEGQSGHKASGGVSVEQKGGRWFVRFAKDFRLDRAPDPRVALGKDGYDASTTLGRLRSRRGTGRYPLRDTIDPAKYNEVWLWCKAFEVPLAVAKLK